MNFADPLVFAGVVPPPSGALRGQLVITGPFPFGPRPGAPDNPFFMDEIEHCSLDDARTILDAYQAMGMNEIILGPAFTQRGYDGQYPATDWRLRATGMEWLISQLHYRGLRPTLVMLPDCLPYFDGHAWDLARWEADFGDIYRALAPWASRGMLAWEVAVRNAQMCEAFTVARRLLPDLPIDWHNPPGHLSPATSDEDEQQAWRNIAAAGCAGLAMQASPPGSDTHLPPIEQMRYDLHDIYRRFNGTDGSPWGAPILGLDGKPLAVWYREGVATTIYHGQEPPSIAHTWAQTALSVPGIVDSGDGA